MIDEKKLIEALKLSNSHHASNSREQSLVKQASQKKSGLVVKMSFQKEKLLSCLIMINHFIRK